FRRTMTERPALLLRIAPTTKPGRLADECRAASAIRRTAPTATQQDVGCCKLLQQHMYGRARFLMLARPVRSPLHDVRQQADGRFSKPLRISVLMDEIKAPTGGASRDRTDDLMLAKHALSQLSYGPVTRRRMLTLDELVGLGRLELPTSRLSSARSNQLSYKPLHERPDAVRDRQGPTPLPR